MKKTISEQKIRKENAKEFEIMRKNFKALRQAGGWSIFELSKISGINKKTLSDIEEGEDFEVQYLIELCSVYQIKPCEIFSHMV